ncbi:transcriptional regulator NanR [Cereibacter sp. SYSU M97828]|nr:transcriptional regulator NanR [Cereibacter flavus]
MMPTPSATDDRIVRQKLSDLVLERLTALVLNGELKPGDIVPSERDLMARFGVGRPAVREALQAMQMRGLITIVHGERSRVNQLTPEIALHQADMMAKVMLSTAPEALDHLKDVRRLFETGMVRIAATLATPEDTADLRELVDRQRTSLGDPPTFIGFDIAFHRRIAQISGNPILGAVSDAMLNWVFQYHNDLLHWSGREDVTLGDHLSIVERIEARDAAGAVAAMEAHLDRSTGVIQRRDA